jgi:hypothetical protein
MHPDSDVKPADSRGVDTREMVRLYVDCGMSISNIARALGVSYSLVHKRLAAEGVTFRPRGGYYRITTTEGIVQSIANDCPVRKILVALRDNGSMYGYQIKATTGVTDTYRYLDVLKEHRMVCDAARQPDGGRIYVRLTKFGRTVLAQQDQERG